MVLRPFRVGIIPLREIIGNYNRYLSIPLFRRDYTLERDNRELQLYPYRPSSSAYYTLERDNRELQHMLSGEVRDENYTLERDNRELQPYSRPFRS